MAQQGQRERGAGSKKNSSQWQQSGRDSMGRAIYKKIAGTVFNGSKKERDKLRKYAKNPMSDAKGVKVANEKARQALFESFSGDYSDIQYDEKNRPQSITMSSGEVYDMTYYNDEYLDVVMVMTDENGEEVARFDEDEIAHLSTIYTLASITGMSKDPDDPDDKGIPVDDKTVKYAYMDKHGSYTIKTSTGYIMDLDYDSENDSYKCYLTDPHGKTITMERNVEEEELSIFVNEALGRMERENKQDVLNMSLGAAQAAVMAKMYGNSRGGRRKKKKRKIPGSGGNPENLNGAQKMAGGFLFGPIMKWLEKGFAPLDKI